MATNMLQSVQLYEKSALAYMQNLNCFVGSLNTKFKDFNQFKGQLGDTVTMELPYRFTAAEGLVAVSQPVTQRKHSLVLDRSANVTFDYTSPEEILNLGKDGRPSELGVAAIYSLAAQVEGVVAKTAHSAVEVMVTDPSDPSRMIPSGALHTESGPYRFYNDGVTAINSYQQLQQAVENLMELGNPGMDMKFYVPNSVVPAIIGSGLGQFVPKRNDDIANSWEIGAFGTPLVNYYKSNMLPVHYSGAVGNASGNDRYLTIVSVNDPTGANVTQITCTSTLTSTAKAVRAGDVGSIISTSGYTTPHATTHIGGVATSQPIQMRIASDANTDVSGNITITIIADDENKGLCWQAGNPNQNCDISLEAGMRIQIYPTHRCGILVSGNAFYLAMPRLPDQSPYDSHAEYDESTGVSMRVAAGSLLGLNKTRVIHDCIYACTLVPSYSMRILFPIS
jgi:hypothetical protein